MSKKSSTFAPAFEKRSSLVRLSSCTMSCTRSVSLAQLVEQLTLNQWVESSSLSGDTKRCNEHLFLFPVLKLSREFLSRFARTIIAKAIFESLGGHKRTSIRVSFYFILDFLQSVLPPQFG